MGNLIQYFVIALHSIATPEVQMSIAWTPLILKFGVRRLVLIASIRKCSVCGLRLLQQ